MLRSSSVAEKENDLNTVHLIGFVKCALGDCVCPLRKLNSKLLLVGFQNNA